MPRVRRRATRSAALPSLGTIFEVCAVCLPATQGPLGGPVLRPVGSALVNSDQTITAWLGAQPQSGTLLLRPVPRPARLGLVSQRDQADDLDGQESVGQATS